MSVENRWLIELISKTELIEHSGLTRVEKKCILEKIFNNKSFLEIACELHLTSERIRQILNSGIRKVVGRATRLNLENIELRQRVAKLEAELQKQKFIASRRNRPNKKLASGSSERTTLVDAQSIEVLRLSVRARKALVSINVDKISDLKRISQYELESKSGIGIKTIHEIVRAAEEIGITIPNAEL